jgi:hypothetical protein
MNQLVTKLNPPSVERIEVPPGSTLTAVSNGSAALDVQQWLDQLNAIGIKPSDLIKEIAEVLEEREAEEEPLEEMGSDEKKNTGIDNVVFLSPRGRAPHQARIKVAIDPPDSLNPGPGTKQASIAVHDGSVSGERIPSDLYLQILEFIDLNREVLLDYWDYKISTTMGLKPLPKRR